MSETTLRLPWCAYFDPDTDMPGTVRQSPHDAGEGPLFFFVPVADGAAVRVPVCEEHAEVLRHHSHAHSHVPAPAEHAVTPPPADVDRARELAGLMDRIQSDPGGKLDRILGELAAIRSTLDDVSARLAALEEPTTPVRNWEGQPPPGRITGVGREDPLAAREGIHQRGGRTRPVP